MNIKEFFNPIIDCLSNKKDETFALNALPEDILVEIFHSFSFKDLTTTVCLVSKTWKNIAERPFLHLTELRSVFTFLKFHYRPRLEMTNQAVNDKFTIDHYFLKGIEYEFRDELYRECFSCLNPTVSIRENQNRKVFLVKFEKHGLSMEERLEKEIKELNRNSLKADFILQENLKLISNHLYPYPRFLLFPFNWKVILIHSDLSPSQLDFIQKLQSFIYYKFDQRKSNLKALNRFLESHTNL